MIVESRAVLSDGGLFQNDPIGWIARSCRGILFGHPLLHAFSRVADFEQTGILRVGIIVGVDFRLYLRALGKEFLISHRTKASPVLLAIAFYQANRADICSRRVDW